MLCKFGKYNKITNIMRNTILLFTLILTFFGSCVSPKIHNALVADYENTQRNLSKKEKENLKLSDDLEELISNVDLLNEKILKLRNDSGFCCAISTSQFLEVDNFSPSRFKNEFAEIETSYCWLSSFYKRKWCLCLRDLS